MKRSKRFVRACRRATCMSIAISSARWWACSRSAVIVCRARGRKRAGRFMCRGWGDTLEADAVDLVLLDAKETKAEKVRAKLAASTGKIVPVVMPDANGYYDWTRLVRERTVTINTAAAGGNTALLSMSEGI